jgi:hypothetical protein
VCLSQTQHKQLGTPFRVPNKEKHIPTTKASGLSARVDARKADLLEKKGETYIIDAWALRYDEMMKRGMNPTQYHKAYKNDEKRLTDYSLSVFDKYLGAIKRAVKKYGTFDNAKKAFLLDTRKEYISIREFIAWAPAGQRAKNASTEKKFDVKREAVKYSVKELEQMLSFRKRNQGDKFAK